MSKTQVAHNMKIDGGFLPLLARAIPFLTGTVLLALGVGALSSLASTGVQKLVGNGLYIKKGGCICEVETYRKRLLLEPVSGKRFTKYSDGLYLRKKGRVYDGIRSKQSSQKYSNFRYVAMKLIYDITI